MTMTITMTTEMMITKTMRMMTTGPILGGCLNRKTAQQKIGKSQVRPASLQSSWARSLTRWAFPKYYSKYFLEQNYSKYHLEQGHRWGELFQNLSSQSKNIIISNVGFSVPHPPWNIQFKHPSTSISDDELIQLSNLKWCFAYFRISQAPSPLELGLTETQLCEESEVCTF